MYMMSWNELEGLCFELIKRLKEKNKDKQIDTIVCVSRGGLFLGKVLSEMLGKPLAVISAKYLGHKYTVGTISTIYPVKGRVLLVDDVMEPIVYDIVKVIKQNKAVTSVELACLFYRKKKQDFVPDFTINEIVNEIWVTFPYQLESLKEHSR